MIISKFPKGLDRQAVAKFLLEHYPITDIADTAAYYLDRQDEKISITRKQFEHFFKIRGIREDGTPEFRGRPALLMPKIPKKDEE